MGAPTRYQTNAFGETTSETSPDIGQLSYQFDAAGRITGITQNLWALQDAIPATPSTPATAASLFATPVTWTVGYDARDHLTSFGRAAASTQYSFDANSNRLSAIDTTTSKKGARLGLNPRLPLHIP